MRFLGILLGAAALSFVHAKAKKRRRRRMRMLSMLSEIRALFTIPLHRMRTFEKEVQEHMERGLQGNPDGMMMLPSFVERLPTGEERGEYYSIDLGGTNLRVLWVRLGEEKGLIAEKEMWDWPIPEDCFETNNGLLMDWIAEKLLEAAEKRLSWNAISGREGKAITVGFCFSFACEQEALNEGRLLLWTKNFRGNGLLGQDVVKALIDACTSRGASVSVPVLVNDTVATLIARRYTDPTTVAGIILGTGTNCAYVESTHRILALQKLMDGKEMPNRRFGPTMVVNTEWSDMMPAALPRCEEDLWVDCSSNNPGRGLFEKLISGLYLGEITRRLLFRLAEHGGLFASCRLQADRVSVTKALMVPHILPAAAVAAIDQDDSHDLRIVASTVHDCLGFRGVNSRDLQITKEVCGLVCIRAARLCAAAIAAVLKRCPTSTGPFSTIAVDGSLFANYEAFRRRLKDALAELIGKAEASRIRLEAVRDASVEGAAYLAAATVAG